MTTQQQDTAVVGWTDDNGTININIDNNWKPAEVLAQEEKQAYNQSQQSKWDEECQQIRKNNKHNKAAYQHLLAKKDFCEECVMVQAKDRVQKTVSETGFDRAVNATLRCEQCQSKNKRKQSSALSEQSLSASRELMDLPDALCSAALLSGAEDLLPPVVNVKSDRLPLCQKCKGSTYQQHACGTITCVKCVDVPLFEPCTKCADATCVIMKDGGMLWCIQCALPSRVMPPLSRPFATARPRPSSSSSSSHSYVCGNSIGSSLLKCKSTDISQSHDTGEFWCRGCKQQVEYVPYTPQYDESDPSFSSSNADDCEPSLSASKAAARNQSVDHQQTTTLYDARSRHISAMMYDEEMLDLSRKQAATMAQIERDHNPNMRALLKEMISMVNALFSVWTTRSVSTRLKNVMANADAKKEAKEKIDVLLLRYVRARKSVHDKNSVVIHCFREIMSSKPFCYELTIADVKACMDEFNGLEHKHRKLEAPERFEGESVKRRKRRNASEKVAVYNDAMYMGRKATALSMVVGLEKFRDRIMRTFPRGMQPTETGILSRTLTRFERVERHVDQITGKMSHTDSYQKLCKMQPTGPPKVGVSHPVSTDDLRVKQLELERIRHMIKRVRQTLPGTAAFENEPAADELIAAAIISESFSRMKELKSPEQKKYSTANLMRIITGKVCTKVPGTKINNIIQAKGLMLESMSCLPNALTGEYEFFRLDEVQPNTDSVDTVVRCMQRIQNHVEAAFAHQNHAGERSIQLLHDNKDIQDQMEKLKDNEVWNEIRNPWAAAAVLLITTFRRKVLQLSYNGVWDSKYQAYRFANMEGIIRTFTGKASNVFLNTLLRNIVQKLFSEA